MTPSKSALWEAAIPGARRVLELQKNNPKFAVDAVVDGLKRTVWDDASFKQVEDCVAKLSTNSSEVVLRCMVYAVNTSTTLEQAEVAVIARANDLAAGVCYH